MGPFDLRHWENHGSHCLAVETDSMRDIDTTCGATGQHSGRYADEMAQYQEKREGFG